MVFLNYMFMRAVPDHKVHGANMAPTWVLSAPDGPHVGPMNLAIRGGFPTCLGSNISLCRHVLQTGPVVVHFFTIYAFADLCYSNLLSHACDKQQSPHNPEPEVGLHAQWIAALSLRRWLWDPGPGDPPVPRVPAQCHWLVDRLHANLWR